MPIDLDVEVAKHQHKCDLQSPVAISIERFFGVQVQVTRAGRAAQFQDLVDTSHYVADILACNMVTFSVRRLGTASGTHSNEISPMLFRRLRPV